MNIGLNPTVNGISQSIEIHFFHFDENLYGKEIQVNIHERIREEQKFESLQKLKEQLEKDKQFSFDFLNS